MSIPDRLPFFARATLLAAGFAFIFGCASYQPPKDGQVDVMARAQSASEGKTRVTVAVLTTEEAKAEFGAPFASKDIQAVWLGKIVRVIDTETGGESRIDPGIDEARYYLTQDIAYSEAIARLGFVRAMAEERRDQPRGTLAGDTYYTDGLRVIFVIGSSPTSLDEIQFFDWEHLDQTSRAQKS